MLHYQSDCPEGKTIINPFKLLDYLKEYHSDFVSWKMKKEQHTTQTILQCVREVL